MVVEDGNAQPSEARLRRRQQDREAKRTARSAYIEESKQLKETIRALTNKLYRLRGTLLPWKEIASELQHNKEVSCLNNKQLKYQVNYYKTLAWHLNNWIHQMQPAVVPPGLSLNAWQDVCLSNQAEIRNLAISWISKQLTFAADGHLQPANFPYSNEDSIKVEWGRKGRRFIYQMVVQATPEEATMAIWSLNRASSNHVLPSKTIPDGVVKILYANVETNSRLHYVREEFDEIYGHSVEHVMHLRLTEKDRILVALRTIAQDEAYEPRSHRESFQEWNEIRSIGDGKCIIRSIIITEPARPYETMNEYMQTLYSHQYALACAANKSYQKGTLAWEQYLERHMLTYGIACSRHYFDFYYKILDHVKRCPELYVY